MDEYDIKANWVRPTTTLPASGTRCIVTDGDVIVIATYVAQDGQSVWIFSGLNENDSSKFAVQGWMTLPKPIKKIVSYESKDETKNGD